MLTQAQPGGRFMPPFFIWVFYCAKHQDTPAYNNTQLLPRAGTPRRWEQLWPQEGAWELGGSPLVFVVFVINRCCGSLSRLLLESMWIFTISDYSSAGVTGKSDCASWGWPEGLLSHHSLRTGLWNWKQTQEWRTGAEGSGQWMSRGKTRRVTQAMMQSSQGSTGFLDDAELSIGSFIPFWIPWVKDMCVVLVPIFPFASPSTVSSAQKAVPLPGNKFTWWSNLLRGPLSPEPFQFGALSLFQTVLTSEGMHSAIWRLHGGFFKRMWTVRWGEIGRMKDHLFIHSTNKYCFNSFDFFPPYNL